MRQSSYQQVFAVAAMVILGLTASGCQSDGPEFIGGDTRTIEGILQTDEVGESDFFALTRVGTVNIQVTSLTGLDPDTGDPLTDPVVVIGVGAPNPVDETTCQLTFSSTLGQGESFSVYFREGLFCLSVFRLPGSLETTEYAYVLTLTGAFS